MNEISFNLRENELTNLFLHLSNTIKYLLNEHSYPCILLSGDLGAGKTTLIREWLKHVGSKDLANSPTFALHNIYDWNHIIVHHFDLYRLKDISEIDELGFEEIWGKEGISFIEWWKIAENKIPFENRVYIDIEHDTEENRIYRVSTRSS
jgi:tRNA threonylcarbamoyladenosine biosynthesis protein TsaE